MTKWPSRSRYFKVKIYYTPKGRAQITIPAPIIQGLAKPDFIEFSLGEDRILVDFKHDNKPASTN
jgi:hypothetical protein